MATVRKISPKKIDTLGRIFAAVLIVTFGALISHQVIRPFLAAKRSLGSVRAAVRILAPAEGDLDRLMTQIEAVTAEIDASEARLPAAATLDAFLERLGETGRATSVHVEKLTPRSIEEHGQFRELKVDIRVTGKFLAIYAFITRLEETGQLTRVEQMQLVTSETSDICAADMRLALYFAPEEHG